MYTTEGLAALKARWMTVSIAATDVDGPRVVVMIAGAAVAVSAVAGGVLSTGLSARSPTTPAAINAAAARGLMDRFIVRISSGD
jgi:hypothetical protein